MNKILIAIFIFFFSCMNSKFNNNNNTLQVKSIKLINDSSLFKVYKIDSINNYYLIYAKRRDTFYKIVSQKWFNYNCKNIIIGSKYSFILTSIWNTPIIIENENVSPSMILHVTCLSFDKKTNICLERDSINDLFSASNVKGLCFIKD